MVEKESKKKEKKEFKGGGIVGITNRPVESGIKT